MKVAAFPGSVALCAVFLVVLLLSVLGRTDDQARASVRTTPSCPVYVATKDGGNGVGDQLTRYFMAFAVAAQLGGTALVDGSWGVAPHHAVNSADEYSAAVRDVLGVRAQQVSSVRAAEHPAERTCSPHAAAAIAAEACKQHTRVLLTLDPESCPQFHRSWHRFFMQPPIRWCPTHPAVPGLDHIGWQLRAHAAAQSVVFSVKTLRFFEPGKMNIAIHVRNGDICVSCGERAEFSYETLLGELGAALQGCALRLVFFAQDPLPWVHTRWPGAVVVGFANATVSDVARHFLAANVLITGGSSFATSIAAFAQPFHPVVLEALTKEATWGCRGRGCPGRSYVLQSGTSVRLDRQGRFVESSAAELRALLQLQQTHTWTRACAA